MTLKQLLTLLKRKIRGSLSVAKEGGMTVEDEVTVMGGVEFGSEPYLITLKRGARISFNVSFITHDGGTYAFRNMDKYKGVMKFGKIEVGEYSFVGAGSIIMPGVKIGSHSVIGAGSIVTKDIPDNVVALGSPARVVCSIEEYAEKCLAQMPDDFDYAKYKEDKKRYLLEVADKFK